MRTDELPPALLPNSFFRSRSLDESSFLLVLPSANSFGRGAPTPSLHRVSEQVSVTSKDRWSYVAGTGANKCSSSFSICSGDLELAISSAVRGGSHDESRRCWLARRTLILFWITSASVVPPGAMIGTCQDEASSKRDSFPGCHVHLVNSKVVLTYWTWLLGLFRQARPSLQLARWLAQTRPTKSSKYSRISNFHCQSFTTKYTFCRDVQASS